MDHMRLFSTVTPIGVVPRVKERSLQQSDDSTYTGRNNARLCLHYMNTKGEVGHKKNNENRCGKMPQLLCLIPRLTVLPGVGPADRRRRGARRVRDAERVHGALPLVRHEDPVRGGRRLEGEGARAGLAEAHARARGARAGDLEVDKVKADLEENTA